MIEKFKRKLDQQLLEKENVMLHSVLENMVEVETALKLAQIPTDGVKDCMYAARLKIKNNLDTLFNEYY